MSRISKTTVKSLLTLIELGEIKARELPDKELVDRLLSSGCIKKERITKSSSRFVLIHEEGLRFCCGDYDERLKDLEGCLEVLETGFDGLKPSEEIAKFGRDHIAKRNLWRGFFLKANKRITVSYNNQTVFIGPESPLLVEKPELLKLNFEEVSLWVVENYECFQNISWMELFPEGNDPSLIICRWPASKQARLAYGKWPVHKKHYFGDLDPAGINIFQTEYSGLFGSEAFELPSSFKNDICKGSSTIFFNQKKYWGIIGLTPKIQACIKTILEQQKGLLQEYYLNTLSN